MSTFVVLISPFAVAALIGWAAHRSGSLFDDDSDGRRLEHELDAIRTRFEHRPSWPASGALGERR